MPSYAKTFFTLAVLLNASLATAAGTQFITGACSSDADCASGCCGFKSGKCAGPVVAQERDGGCGFGNAQPNADAARAFGFTGQPGQAAGSQQSSSNGQQQQQQQQASGAQQAAPAAAQTSANTGSGKPPGTQFITGVCGSDADCASGCCGFKSGKCAGAIVAQERDGGCGFGNAQPNADAAKKLGFTGQPGQAAGSQNAAAAPVAKAAADPAASQSSGAAANGGSGKPPGTQFITGPCASDADCASSCCGFNSGKCAGPVIAQTRDGGCGHGDAQPNDTAAKAFFAAQGQQGAKNKRSFLVFRA